MKNRVRHPGSFRDTSGFVFYQNGAVYRQINRIYQRDYDHLINSGLYAELVGQGLLIPHAEVGIEPVESEQAYRVIKPEQVAFVSYPYEWCFSQLKNSALCTLDIQRRALTYGMSLKDCSAYNIQFNNCRPIFIDTLSFERYQEGRPWVAYGQFCRHFLGPLALMSYRDLRLNQLLRVYLDGIPLDLSSSLLPRRTYLRFSLLTHLHLHAKSQLYFSDKRLPDRMKNNKVNRRGLLNIIDSLEFAIKKLKGRSSRAIWSEYYTKNSYTSAAFRQKKEIVSGYLDQVKPASVWDLGANTGVFSRIAASKGAQVISFDNDPWSIELNYNECLGRGEKNILPLLIDFVNPSPRLGWANQERTALIERGPADMVLALALLHHLALSNNLPLERIAEFFHAVGKSLVVEFIPKQDRQVQEMLRLRKDIFTEYSREAFEEVFSKYFTIQSCNEIIDSKRILYLIKRRLK